MIKKGFWVVILLVLAVGVSAVEFQWQLTQYIRVEQSSDNCDINAKDAPEALKLQSSDCNIEAFASINPPDDRDWWLQVGVAILAGDVVSNSEWYAFDNDHRGTYQKAGWKSGKGDRVTTCAKCWRRTTVNRRYETCAEWQKSTVEAYVKIPGIKSNVTFADGKKPLGTVSDFAKRCYVTAGTYTPETTNPNVYIYIENQENIFACIDADQDKRCDIDQAASCLPPYDWNAKWYAKTGDYCCGVDLSYTPTTPPYCEYYTDLTAICGKDTAGDWKWVASAVEGQSRKLACPTPISFLAGGQSSIYYCGNKSATVFASNAFDSFDNNNMREIAHHEFICTPSTATITECVGDEGTLSDGNNYKTTGEWINQTGIQFCSAENKWITDLNADKKTCIAARQKQTWSVAWTGAKCCGDPLDDNTAEGTYEDKWVDSGEGTAGGCYNNTFIASGEFTDAGRTIINYKGEFYSCGQSKTLGSITTHVQQTCGTPLLNATLVGTKHHIVCTPEGNWMFTNNTATTQATSTTWSTSQGCCLDTQCWDGQDCRNIGEYQPMDDRGYRCTAD
ncbi:MAG: hypothetical protein NTW67_00290 [Candidatus Woesearchaeota archaeon]|nr:hypothetical protein [Candidatus Woesearchaeota archaeon]